MRSSFISEGLRVEEARAHLAPWRQHVGVINRLRCEQAGLFSSALPRTRVGSGGPGNLPGVQRGRRVALVLGPLAGVQLDRT